MVGPWVDPQALYYLWLRRDDQEEWRLLADRVRRRARSLMGKGRSLRLTEKLWWAVECISRHAAGEMTPRERREFDALIERGRAAAHTQRATLLRGGR
jgi:hypothetical protein